jgi:hypothetical protein
MQRYRGLTFIRVVAFLALDGALRYCQHIMEGRVSKRRVWTFA